MLRVVDNNILNFLIGLIPTIIIFLFELITTRRKTLPIMLIGLFLGSILSVLIAGKFIYIVVAILAAIIIYLKLRDKYDEEYAYLDYSKGIISISKFINAFNLNKDKQKGIVIGTVLPVSYNDIKNNGKAIYLTEDALSRGSMITGATGSGKTTTLINIMTQGVQKNKPIFFFDFKGESDILDKLEELAQSAKIDYYEFSARRIDFKYDPFINLNSTGKIQALMNSKAWSADGSDSYYKTALQALLQDLIPTYEEYREQNYDESNFIIGLSEYIRSEYKVAPNHKDGFGTLKSIIDLMVTSRIREMLEGENKVEFSFDSDKPCIVAFSFISSNKDLANYICSFIFQDIMDRGTRRRYVNKPLLVIDEFGTLANSALIKDILEKGRSVGLQTIISLQDINQIVENISRDFAISILGTISTFVIHPGATQTSAELMGSTYRYDSVEFDIMNLEMPQDGKPPTCAFISKIRVLNDRGAQEMHKMIPYSAKPINKQEEKQKINPNKMYKSTNLINYDEIMKGYEVKEETPIEDENS